MKTNNKPCKRKKCPYYYMHGYSEKCDEKRAALIKKLKDLGMEDLIEHE